MKSKCKPEDVAIKSFFLGPQSENATWMHEMVLHVFRRWYAWRKELYPDDGEAITEENKLSDLFTAQKDSIRDDLDALLNRFEDEVPSFSPRYIGHMLTEISMPALLGHIITLLHNPNNISGDVSRVGLAIEKEAVDALMRMTGLNPEKGFGHFTSGGTVANFEGSLRARSRLYRWLAVGAAAKGKGIFRGGLCDAALMGWEMYNELQNRFDESEIAPFHFLKSNPFEVAQRLVKVFGESWKGPVMLVPSNKHYSWTKSADILGLGEEAFWSVKTDREGRLCVRHLSETLDKARKENRPVMLVVTVAGTTELGEFDPINDVQNLLDHHKEKYHHHIWHHVDAAYGGFYCTLMHQTDYGPEDPALPPEVRNALLSIRLANSLTIDPHKLGYVPYASGAFLCADRREYYHLTIKAPYIAFGDEQNSFQPGPQTLEGSRSAAGAVSTWLTANAIGFNRDGYGRILERSIHSTNKLVQMLVHADERIRVNPAGDSNIITFCVAENGEPVSVTNSRTLQIYEKFSPESNHSFVVSKTSLGKSDYEELLGHYTQRWDAAHDTDELVLIRLVLMNPFFDTVETNISYPEAFVAELLKAIQLINDKMGIHPELH